MAHDPRWKFPQAKTPEAMWDWAFNLVKELRAGTYLPDADDIAYSNTTSGLAATDVQAAIDENADAIGDLQGVLGLALLGSGTVTNAATLDIDLSGFTTYRAIKFVLTDLLPATDNVELWLRTSSDSGSTFDDGASDYSWAEFFQVGNSGGTFGEGGDNLDSEIQIGANVPNAAAGAASVELTLYSPFNTTANKCVLGTKMLAVDAAVMSYHSGTRLSTAAIDAVRFQFSSGNIASGSWAVYGYA